MTTNLFKNSEDVEIKFKDKDAKTYWRRWRHGMEDTKLVKFTSAWIKCMQYLMKDTEELTKEMIDEAYIAADLEYGVSVFLIIDAKNIISYCWKYGKQFEILTA